MAVWKEYAEGRCDMMCMTFNLRFRNDRDGENAWDLRKHLVVQVIRKYRPSLLGTQEGTMEQLLYLRDHLPEYRMHAPHRTWDDTCQYPTLYYLPDHFRLVDGGEFWLSTSPAVHRSKAWDSAFPRMMNYALLEDIVEARSFWVVVTHLDHIGAQAKLEQGKMIAGWLKKRKNAAIVMGDFNDFPHSAVHGVLVSENTGLQDSWLILGRQEDTASMTHHDFRGVPSKCRMDWVLLTRHFRVTDAVIVRDNSDGRYPSDHFPYAVEFHWIA